MNPADGESAPATPAGQEPRYVPKKSATIMFTSTTLILEAFVVFFATLVVYGLRDVGSGLASTAPDLSSGAIWAVGGVLFVALIALSRRCGKPGGYIAGWVAQAVVIVSGLIVPMMFLVGGMFAVMWLLSLRLGGKVDRERREYDAAHPETAPQQG